MKKIVPFNNVLDFNTDVKEITAISLEHEINKYPDMISGVFYISGEYKIAEALLDKEKFAFELPFDIALTDNYEMDSLLVDIDDFRYDLISDKSLKVNIDLYIDGEIEPPTPIPTNEESIEFLNREDSIEEIIEEETLTEEPQKEEPLIDEKKLTNEDEIIPTEEEKSSNDELDNKENCQEEVIEPERIDLLKEMLTDTKENETMEEKENESININNNNENINTNIFDNDAEETYVTYRVYVVEENDTIDTILTKYNITKELLADYNNIENIKSGDKLIIPTNEK